MVELDTQVETVGAEAGACCPDPTHGRATGPGSLVKELFNVLTPADAYALLERHLPLNVPVELIPTAEALGRVLAEDLHSGEDLPAFPRSTMDGFAVRAADTYGASEGLPAYLSVVGEVLMGRRPEARASVGQAVRIATGGMIPDGADAVVMVEYTLSKWFARLRPVRT
jgi:molybdopterin molybdotransferase